MTALAFVSGPAFVALAADSFAGGDRGRPAPVPPALTRKFHPFPGNRAAVLGGVAGAPGWPESVVSVMDRLAAADDLPGTVAGLARRIEAELLRTFGRRWRPNSGDGVMGFCCGFDPGERAPVVVYLAVSAAGVLAHHELRGTGAGVLPLAERAPVPAPRDLEHARQLAAGLVERRIAEHASNPAAGRPAVAPVHVLTLAPDLAPAEAIA